MKEPQKILEELIGSRPEELNGEAKRLFEAIMKIADERDELLKERQADKEKIKELEKDYAEMLIKLNAQNLNNSIEQRKESNEQLEALHEGWKIELEKKDNRIKELEADNYECNNIIRDYIEDWKLKTKIIDLMAEHLTTPIHSKKDVIKYFENKAKESGEIDDK